MRTLGGDSRFILCSMVAEGMELAGKSMARLFHNLSRTGRLSQQLQKLEASGLLERRGSGRIDERIFRLTAAGRAQALGAVDPEKRWSRPWSGSWTIVAFDVPESDIPLRTRLRRQLRHLRFGWLQNSVWISPDPASTLGPILGARSIAPDSLSIFEGRPAGGENAADVVSAAWDFARLDHDYASYRKILELRPATSQRDAAKWKKWSDMEQRAWRRIAAIDPFLPEALLPAGYSGRKIWRLRLKALADLSSALTEQLQGSEPSN